MDRNTNGTKTDGATNVNIWLPHHTMYVSPAETIDTVNVSTSNFDAEQGNAGGAAITVITKSGTNEFKGRRSRSTTTRTSTRGRTSRPRSRKPARISTASTLGGPIMKNKLFFFGAWEGQYQKTPQQFFYNVPPAALRAGDFSQAFNADGSLQIIYDPRTGNPDGSGPHAVPGQHHPASASISDIAKQIQALYPATNTPAAWRRQRRWTRGLPQLRAPAGPRSSTATTTTSRSTTTCRRPRRSGASTRAWAPTSTSPQSGLGYDGPLTGETTVQMYTFGDTWTISPTMVFDATFAFAKMTHQSTEPDSARRAISGSTTLGIPRHERRAQLQQRPALRRHPASALRCCTNWGGTGIWDTIGTVNTWDPVERDERTYALAGNLTKLSGAHEFRFGYSVNKLRMDHWQPELGLRSARLDAVGAPTRPPLTSAADGQHLQRLRGVPAGPAWTSPARASSTS